MHSSCCILKAQWERTRRIKNLFGANSVPLSHWLLACYVKKMLVCTVVMKYLNPLLIMEHSMFFILILHKPPLEILMESDEEMIEIDILHACNMDITNWNFPVSCCWENPQCKLSPKIIVNLNGNRLAISSSIIGAPGILDYPRHSERSPSTTRRLRTWNSLRRRNSNICASSSKSSASSASSIIRIMEIPDRQTQRLSQWGQNLLIFFFSTIFILK